jgi:short-subunit dehydrogenase
MAFRFEELRDLSIPQRLMAVNYLGSVFCTYYALPHLRASRGRLVGVASLTGRAGVPLRSLYAASKHAMAGFFDSLRIELADTGVSVTMIYPDFVETEVRDRALGPDGRPVGIRPPAGRRFMDAATCARIVVDAAGKRRREVIVGTRGKIGLVLKTFAPGLVDRIARRAIADVTIGETRQGTRQT